MLSDVHVMCHGIYIPASTLNPGATARHTVQHARHPQVLGNNSTSRLHVPTSALQQLTPSDVPDTKAILRRVTHPSVSFQSSATAIHAVCCASHVQVLCPDICSPPLTSCFDLSSTAFHAV